MEEKLLSDYDRLMNVMKEIKDKYEYNVYGKVNEEIEKILSESSDCIKKLEVLV